MPGRVQIPFAFQFPQAAYVAATLNGANTTSATVLEPVVAASVAVTDRNTNNPVTVYSGETGPTTIASVVTDANGNVPGWVNEGSLKLVVAASGSFTGATIAWEAVRGDGVGNLAPGSVTLASLSTAVTQALVPTGAVQDFAGTALPGGYLWCDGSVYPIATYPALSAALGIAWNTGGEGSGNFRVPDFRQRFLLGQSTSGTGSTLGSTGGSIDHTHSIPGLSIPALTIPPLTIPQLYVYPHTHNLSSNGGARIYFGENNTNDHLIIEWGAFNGPSFTQDVTGHWAQVATVGYNLVQPYGNNSFWNGVSGYGRTTGLVGTTDSGDSVTGLGGVTGTGVTGTGTTGGATSSATNPPYAVVNRIIKY